MALVLSLNRIRTALEQLRLHASLDNALRWVERHPQAVVAGALVLAMAALLLQTPSESAAELDSYNDETPLFV